MTNPFGLFRAQPRFFTAALVAILLWFVFPATWPRSTRLLASWDVATALYLCMVLAMMLGSNIDRIRHRAAVEDEGQLVILGLTVVTAIISLAGIAFEMVAAKESAGGAVWPHVALSGITVVLSWTFTHTIFAIHYAHEYYEVEEDGLAEGFEFPGDDQPDYWDFVYYASVIGTACATADVNLTSKKMRRITTFHCVFSFFFNTTILALTVNVGAGFF